MHSGSSDAIEYVHESWPADPRLANAIRDAVHTWLTSLALTHGEVASVVLAVDEAVENITKHAYAPGRVGSAELVLWTEPGTLCIEVIDHGSWQPPVDGTTGEGIPLMERLVESVLIHFDERGTRVLLRYPLPPDPNPPADSESP